LLKLPVPVTVAVNCTCVPIVAAFGETAIELIDAELNIAVTFALELITTAQTLEFDVDVHPDQEEKTLPPAEDGAVSVTVVPAA
jgi:hypothetical protein